MQVDAALGQEGDTALRLRRLVLREVLKLVVLIFVVADVTVTFASKVQALGAFVPEGHADTGYAVQDGKAIDGLSWIARVPETELTITHARETGGSDAVMLAQPHCTTALGSGMALYFNRRRFLSHIPNAELLVSARGDELGAISAPRKRLHNILVLEGQLRLAGFDIPQLHGVVSGGRGEDMVGGRVE